MKVKANKAFVAGRFSASAGDEVEIPAYRADQLIRAGIATKVEPEKTEEETAEQEKAAEMEPEEAVEETAKPEPKKATAKKAVKK